MMDINEILRVMPHHYPILLVDRVLEINPGRSIKALKNVTYNEYFFPGHFPEKPIMPGVLVLEALAQSCCLLVAQYPQYRTIMERGGLLLFTRINNARFKHPVVPGDTLLLNGEILRSRLSGSKSYAKFQTQAFVGDKLNTSAELHLMIRSTSDGADT